MKKVTNIVFYVLLMFVFFNCKKKNKTTTTAYTPTCSGAKSFLNNVLPLIQSNCVSCHSDFNTYTGVKASVTSIRSSIVDGSMPKNSSLSDDQKNTIVCWIDAGALNN